MLKYKEQKELLFKQEDAKASRYEEISRTIFEHPELGDHEFFSSDYLAKQIAAEGFTVTMPYLGLPTAFRAEYCIPGNSSAAGQGPTVAFLAEYDALPGYGPEKDQPAHACGHNWIAASSFAAAVSLKDAMVELGIPGTVVYMGTPAEESTSRKMDLTENGAFDDIDAVFEMHLNEYTNTHPVALANAAYIFEFFGRAAHASQSPETGINALDAVELTFAGINCLRQHVSADVRIHGIVKNGGKACNIIPDYASMEVYTRAAKMDYLKEVNEKVLNCARGAALMTGAELKITTEGSPKGSFMYDLKNDPVLVSLLEENMKEGFGLESEGEYSPYRGASSTDIGNVSYAVPTCYAYMGMREVTSAVIHDEAFISFVDSDYAHGQLHLGAKCMAASALDLMLEPETVRELKSKQVRG